jgi:hypothetical protein
MKFPIGLGIAAALFSATVMLVACKSGDPSPPSFDDTLSSPANLEMFTYAGIASGTTASAATTGIVHYDNASSESLATNPDALTGITLDSSGGSGAISIAPPPNQLPGIYYLGIYAQNTNGTVTNTVVVNVMPPLANQPTIINFPMNGQGFQRNTETTLFVARNEVLSSAGIDLMLADGVTSPEVDGVYVNGISTTLNTGTTGYRVTADISVNSSLISSHLQSVTSTDSNGNSVTVNCLPLQFQATPSSNGYVMTPYTENICLNPI